MRILSLWQPWASFVAWKLKGVETRSWTLVRPLPLRGKQGLWIATPQEAQAILARVS